MDNSYVKFAKSTEQQYSELSKDSSTLYLITDAHKIYLGETPLFPVTPEDLSMKQDALNASTNITIDASNNISALDTRYDASTNIEITENNEILAKGYVWNDPVFSVQGSIQTSAGFFETSDARKKTVKENLCLTKAYNMLQVCSPIIFTLNDDPEKKEKIGFIAQQVQAYFPEIVETLPDGTLTLDYSKISVILFGLLKDMNDRLQTLENR